MKRILFMFLSLLLLLFLWAAATAYFRMKDRHPGYEVDLTVRGSSSAALRAGFAAIDITPLVPDTWTDADSNARFRPRWWARGDSYTDGNGNGRFDPVWIAGFQNNRPAQGVHDPLWARTMILDDSTTRLALVALDAIGFMSDDIIDIRRRLPAALGVDYLIVTSTHTHEAPDLLGLWGEHRFLLPERGVDPAYLEFVKLQVLESVAEAVDRLRPARLRFGHDVKGAAHLVEDSRRPIVLDPGIRLLQAVDARADTTLGVLCAWANHPETLWSDNLLLSSDFPHYVREGLEKGVYHDDTLRAEGLGGVAVYVNGAIGGLMTTSPGFGLFSVQAPTAPESAERLADELEAMFSRFAADGPTPEELRVARDQFATVHEESVRDPGYWVRSLRDMDYVGTTLDDLAAEATAYQRFTPEDVRAIFDRYHGDDGRVRVLVIPTDEERVIARACARLTTAQAAG